MRFKNEWTGVAASLAIFGLLTIGVTLPGCSGTDDSQKEEPKEESSDPEESADPGETTPEPEESTEPGDTPPPEETPAPSTAAIPEVPKVSTFAPAKDLASVVPDIIEDLEEVVETEENYTDYADRVARLSNTLAVVALGLGLHDEDNTYKVSAGTLMKAAQDLAATTDFASAKAAVAVVKAAAESQDPSGVELKWEKVASLAPLMDQVPKAMNTKLKTYVKRLGKRADGIQAYSAMIAVISQGSIYSADETKKPDRGEDWVKYCIAMRDAAMAVNVAAGTGDQEATDAAMTKLGDSCHACHEVFKPEEAEE